MKIVRGETPLYKYALESDYSNELVSFCRQLKEIYSWKEFCFVEGKWRFNNIKIAIDIKTKFPATTIDDNILGEYTKAEESFLTSLLAAEKIEFLKKTNKSDLIIENIKRDFNPYDYQKIGVEFFISNNGRGILADGMGVGKTMQALSYLAHTKKQRALVICPASVKYSWEKEIKKWTNFKYTIVKSTDSADIFLEKSNLFIINYDILKKFLDTLCSQRWDAVIYDECHYIKSSESQRTKCSRLIGKNVQSLLLLSGTPMLSRPVELYTALNLIDPVIWNSYYQYTIKYCGGHRGAWGWEAKGATNIPELQQRIKRYFLRRTKEEVLPELPSKNFIYRPIELGKEIRQKYDLAEEELMEFLIKEKKKKEKEAEKSMQAEQLVKLGILRGLTTEGKIDATKELIEDILEGDEKVLVFSCYNKPLEELHEKFKDISVLLTGKTNEEKRRDLVDQFQTNPETKVFFGGIKSAGVGITLTEATNVIFLSYSWCPSDHAQAMDRAHRIGQKESVNVYFIYAKDSIDEYMVELLERKDKLFRQIINGENIEGDDVSMADELINTYKNKAVLNFKNAKE